MFAKTARIVAINLLVLLTLLAAAELWFGTWLSSDPLDKLGLPRGTAVTVDASRLYPGGGEHVFRRDRWGFRGEVDPARVTIVTIGGSTTNQLYLPEGQTWQAAMEGRLAELGRDGVVVANAGIDGQSTVGHLKALEDWLPHVPGLKPRLVVVYTGINDVHITGAWVDSLKQQSLIKIVRQRSAVVGLFDKVAGQIAARRARLTHERVDWAGAHWTEVANRPGWRSDQSASHPDSYRQRLKLLAERIHGMGAVPVFVTQARGDYRLVGGKVQGLASAEGSNGVDEHRLLDEMNRATLQVCQDDGLLCLDLAREVVFEPGDFYDRLHNTPQGAAKIGRWLAERLAGLV
jgi:lysophospholipase L1-like esterase